MNTTPENIVNENSDWSSYENSGERVVMLSKKVECLKRVCDQIDPYRPISGSMMEELKSFQIFDVGDPFILTNKLILLLEDSIEELHSLEQKMNFDGA